LGHLSGVPAEELIAGFAPVSAVLVLWARAAGQRARARLTARRDP
jgi:hypothetical protein